MSETLNAAIGSRFAEILTDYVAKDSRGLSLEAFLRQQAQQMRPTIYVQGMRWVPAEERLDSGQIRAFSRECLVYLMNSKGVDTDCETVLFGLNDYDDNRNIITHNGQVYMLTTLAAEDREYDFGLPVIAIQLDVRPI